MTAEVLNQQFGDLEQKFTIVKTQFSGLQWIKVRFVRLWRIGLTPVAAGRIYPFTKSNKCGWEIRWFTPSTPLFLRTPGVKRWVVASEINS